MVTHPRSTPAASTRLCKLLPCLDARIRHAPESTDTIANRAAICRGLALNLGPNLGPKIVMVYALERLQMQEGVVSLFKWQ